MSLLILVLIGLLPVSAQSPHGDELEVDCATCHNPASWSINYKTIQFDHNTTTFELEGTHAQTDCKLCHSSLVFNEAKTDCFECHSSGYQGTSTDCNSCHNTDYNDSTNPNHNSVGISTDCITCHTTEPGWIPASFDTHNSIYQLNGAHATIANDCVACHNGDYNNTPNTCVGCHQADYNSTTNPNHSGAQFPTDCMQCHSETAWVPSTFNHDGQYFRINSGTHGSVWNDCMDCHTNANDYSVFTCLTCHTSSQTNNDHSEVAGYTYESIACLQCHVKGFKAINSINQIIFMPMQVCQKFRLLRVGFQ